MKKKDRVYTSFFENFTLALYFMLINNAALLHGALDNSIFLNKKDFEIFYMKKRTRLSSHFTSCSFVQQKICKKNNFKVHGTWIFYKINETNIVGLVYHSLKKTSYKREKKREENSIRSRLMM